METGIISSVNVVSRDGKKLPSSPREAVRLKYGGILPRDNMVVPSLVFVIQGSIPFHTLLPRNLSFMGSLFSDVSIYRMMGAGVAI